MMLSHFNFRIFYSSPFYVFIIVSCFYTICERLKTCNYCLIDPSWGGEYDHPEPNPLSLYFLIDKGPIFLKKYMYFYIKNKKKDPKFGYMRVFVISINLFLKILLVFKKKNIYIYQIIKKNNSLKN